MTPKQILFRALGAGLNALSFVAPRAAGRRAFHRFATPPPPRIRAKEQAFLDTARRDDFDWNGLSLPVYEWGPTDGPVVFCAYGWGYNAGRWRHFVPTLVEAGYRVIAYDPPGHGLAPKSQLDYPKMVDIQRAILARTDGCQLALCHSFGGGCFVESMTKLPAEQRPERLVLMATFTEVYWIFRLFADALRLRDVVFDGMRTHIETITGRDLLSFDVAAHARGLGAVDTLIVHDPEDSVTSHTAAERNHAHWPGSHLWSPRGAGHHLGKPEVTNGVLAFLINGKLPPEAVTQSGPLPEPEVREPGARPAVSGGVSDYYT